MCAACRTPAGAPVQPEHNPGLVEAERDVGDAVLARAVEALQHDALLRGGEGPEADPARDLALAAPARQRGRCAGRERGAESRRESHCERTPHRPNDAWNRFAPAAVLAA